MKESDVYSKIKKDLARAGVLAQRIESGSTACGIPDLFLQCPMWSAWVELKQIEAKKEVFQIPWRPGQLAWIKKYRDHGAIFALVISINDTVYFTLDVKKAYSIEDFYKWDIDFFYRAMIREKKRGAK